jgi:hypothetical protein
MPLLRHRRWQHDGADPQKADTQPQALIESILIVLWLASNFAVPHPTFTCLHLLLRKTHPIVG